MAEGAAVEEVPVWLEVNGEPLVTWMCTPHLLEELAVGWLAGEGEIEILLMQADAEARIEGALDHALAMYFENA